ncbi:MAG: Sorbose-specific phosphotransferase enzyme IIB component [Deltaproteobacteria bacterium ADurb.Bin510]|nr:MAG: Sorbose-specific phosphotransferase enzyme IIB component [Deltaproteobacteria bacterium ADurb.Bin510]
MKLVHLRVDDRFIHGQILEAWIPHTRAEGLVVVNDALAADNFQKTIMSMAVPDRICLRIVGLADFPALLTAREFERRNVMVIVASIEDACALRRQGLAFAELNLGNLATSAGARQLSFSVWIKDGELVLLKELLADGVAINVQAVPRERAIDLRSLMAVE